MGKIPSRVNVEDDLDNIISPATESSTEEKFYDTLIDDFTTANVTYIGKAISGTAESASTWQIKAIVETGDYAKILFADDVTTFTKEWDERASYSY